MSRTPVKPTHRGSHEALVVDYEASGYAPVHAIIVPTIRKPARLKDAFALGAQLECPVLVLSSRWSNASAVHAMAAGHNVTAIDVTESKLSDWPVFATSELLAQREYRLFAQDSDLSLKRNLGLAIARMAGWEHVLFLDDDITGLDPLEITKAAGGLTAHHIMALKNVGFPDNSVVCHALRKVGKHVGVIQHSFVGGGAMSVAAQRSESFFPNIYNEDWFFMLGHFAKNPGGYPVGRAGRAFQELYDPFLRPLRARTEELGDCLAEGLFALLDQKETIEQATLSYWKEFLADRRELLARILYAIPRLELEMAVKANMLSCVQAALGRTMLVTARLCAEYMQRWNEDTLTWQTFIDGLPHPENLPKALNHLGLDAR